MKNTIATTLAALLDAGFPDAVPEFRFAPPRRWRFDLCWPDFLLALEVEGLTRPGTPLGRHQRNAGLARDAEKYNEAVLRGWRLIRVTTRQIETGQALNWLLRALGVTT